MKSINNYTDKLSNISGNNLRKVFLLVGILNVCSLILAGSEQLYVLIPILGIADTAVFFWSELYKYEHTFPLLDIGSIYMAAFLVYTLLPFVGFLLSGMTYTPLSAIQLFVLAPTPEQFGIFALRYFVFIFCFAFFYLKVRRAPQNKVESFIRPDRSVILGFIVLFTLLSAFYLVLKLFFNIDFNTAYDENMYTSYEAYKSLPLFAGQVVTHLNFIFFTVKIGLMVILLTHWEKKSGRLIVVAWLGFIVIGYFFKMGARTEIVLLLMAFVLLYDRFVKPIKRAYLFPAGGALLVTFILIGYMRGGGKDLKSNLDNLERVTSSDYSLFSSADEFQAIFAGAYDLHNMKENGLIKDVPWQLHINELLLVLPRQFLPFEKIDPQAWYLDSTEFPQGYFMYGPISQAELGLGWIELALRGGLLGFIYAKLHRYYVGNKNSFWVTLFYLFLTIMSYYSIRSSTFYLIVPAIYHFIPTYLIITCISYLHGFKYIPKQMVFK